MKQAAVLKSDQSCTRLEALVGGLLGHTQAGQQITELYAEYSPNFMSSVTAAIDAFFEDLDPLQEQPLLAVELEEQPRIDDLRPERAMAVSRMA